MDETSVRAICELFDLGVARGEPLAVGGGLTNRMWRLDTDRGAFAVKEMNRDFGRSDYVAWFDRSFTLERGAFRAGVPMPRPVPVTASGRCLGELPGTGEHPTTVRVHVWVDGVRLENRVVYPTETSARVAAILARIHSLEMATAVDVAQAPRVFGEEHWRARAERAEHEGADWAPDLRRALRALAELEAYLLLAHSDPTPLLLSHRDSDMKNFIRTPAGELVLVDWDAAAPVNPRHDLANQALVWAGVHLGDPDMTLARTFIGAYRRGAGTNDRFRATDLAELVAARLSWYEFNVRRALGERMRDDSDRQFGVDVVRQNTTQLPRFAQSLDSWLAVLQD